MAKWANDLMMDAGLDYLAGSTRQTICSGQPANFAGIAAVALGSVALDAGDFSKANGDISGRKLVVAAQAGVPLTATGTANHIAYDDGATLRYVTTCASQALTSGGTATVQTHDMELADPT